MSTSAETSTPARKVRGRLPVYKRRRRRIYGAAALVLAVIVGVVVWATTGGSSGSDGAAQLHHLGQPGLGGQPGQHHREPDLAVQADPREAALRAVRGRRDRDRRDEERRGPGHQRSRQPSPHRGHRQRHRRDRGHGLGLRRRPAARAGLGDVARPAGRQVRGRARRLLRGLRAAGLPRVAAPDRQGQGSPVLRRERGGRGRAVRGGQRRLRLRQPGHQAARPRATTRWSTPSRSPSSASPA